MSLQIWLPLNGNLDNQGLNGSATVTNYGATVDDSGKIGKCYYFNSGYAICDKTSTDLFQSDDHDLSLCCWVYQTERSSGYTGLVCCNIYAGSGFGINLLNNKICFLSNTSTQYAWDTGYTLPLNEWHHITFTFSSGVKKFYLDGNYVSSYSNQHWSRGSGKINIGRGNQGGWGNLSNAKINDVRIYDHCLSAKEVKEISKGLALHYKFDDSYITTTNILPDCSGYKYNGTLQTSTITTQTDSPRYQRSTHFTRANTDHIISSFYPHNWPEFTSTCWFKKEDSERGIIYSSYRGLSNPCIELEVNSSIRLCFIDEDYTLCQWTPFSIPNGVWIFCGVTYKDHTFTCYIYNSSTKVLNKAEKTDTNFNLISSSVYRTTIGKMDNNPFYLNGNLSDLRIYSTCLPEDDIKELYTTSASVDKNGNLHCFKVLEGSTLNVSKAGIVTSDAFNEEGLLPSGYSYIEYLQANPGCAVGIGINNQNHLKINIEVSNWEKTTTSSDWYFITDGRSYSTFSGVMVTRSPVFYIGRNGASTGLGMTEVTDNVYATYEINDDEIIYDTLFCKGKAVNAGTYSGNEMRLISGSSSVTGYIRCTGATAYVNNVLVRNLIPALRKSDITPGLYDTISNTFYTGAGTFTYGAVSDSPFRIYKTSEISTNSIIEY